MPQCSRRSEPSSPGPRMLATSPQAYTPAALVQPAQSVSNPPSSASPTWPLASSVLGFAPAPTTTRSQAQRERSSSVDRSHAPVRAALDPATERPVSRLHPGGTGARAEPLADLGPERARERRRARVDDRHMRAERDRARGDLEADEARADATMTRAPGTSSRLSASASPACAGGGRPPRRGWRGAAAPEGRSRARDDGSARARRRRHEPGLDVERLDRTARAHLDASRLPEPGRPQRERAPWGGRP